MGDTLIYRWLRWLNEGTRQTFLTFLLWRWRAAHEDRTRLKQRVRELEASRGQSNV